MPTFGRALTRPHVASNNATCKYSDATLLYNRFREKKQFIRHWREVRMGCLGGVGHGFQQCFSGSHHCIRLLLRAEGKVRPLTF